MQALLEHFITQSTAYSLMAVVLVAFLESLALVGLILPGTVLMAGLGALIGSGELSFWHAWMAGIVGCLLGDWISFWLGWRFKKPLHRWSFLKKNKALLDKTEHALHQHSMFTILVGRFVGPTRPLVPMVAANAVSDSVKHITFSAPAYVSVTRASAFNIPGTNGTLECLLRAVFNIILILEESQCHKSECLVNTASASILIFILRLRFIIFNNLITGKREIPT